MRYLSGINPKLKKSKLLYKKGYYKKFSEFLDGHDWEKNFAHKNVHGSYIEMYNGEIPDVRIIREREKP